MTADPEFLVEVGWRVLVPTVLLTGLGWWGLAGFTRRSTGRSLVPFLPLVLLLDLLPLLTLVTGVAGHGAGHHVLAAVSVLAVGFGDEALYRGVVLQTLLPRGAVRAVLLSSALYGAAYLTTIAVGVDPAKVGVQAVNSAGVGVAFAALVVVTGTIWPLVLVDAAWMVVFYLVPAGSSRPDVVTAVVEVAMGALAAAYGIWLLRRHDRRPADEAGETPTSPRRADGRTSGATR
jgi:membrane protease YdiL (CAAX protease family)